MALRCTEFAALLMLLAERHPAAGLAPAAGTAERARWLEQMVYLANTLLPAMRDWFYADKDGDPAGADAVRALARRRIEGGDGGCWTHGLAAANGFLVGGRLSTADLMAVMLMRWTRNTARPATSWPNLAGYIERMRALPSFVELCRRERLTEWLNAA